MSSIKRHIFHPLKMGWYNLQIAIGGAWHFFCKQQKQQEVKITRTYYNNQIIENPDNAIIFQCNGFTWHGGLADRLKGIIAVYEWCKRNRRIFRINFVEPFTLQNYLIPNQVDWLPRSISYSMEQAEVKQCLMEPRTCYKKEVIEHQDELLESWLNENLVKTDKQLHIYTNMKRFDVQFCKSFHELFRPCPRLQKEVEYHKNKIGGKYISISLRFTTLLGDFTDCTGHPLSAKDKEKLIAASIEVVKEIGRKVRKHKILITADSMTFLSHIQKLPNVYVIPGKVGHIDYDHGDDINMKTFLDFFMIANAEAVFLAKTPEMYKSAFAETAAMVNDRSFNVIEYDWK